MNLILLSNRRTPLMYACVEDHVSVVNVLLEYRADPLAKDMLHNEWNCLHFAIMQVHYYTLFDLLSLCKPIIDIYHKY